MVQCFDTLKIYNIVASCSLECHENNPRENIGVGRAELLTGKLPPGTFEPNKTPPITCLFIFFKAFHYQRGLVDQDESARVRSLQHRNTVVDDTVQRFVHVHVLHYAVSGWTFRVDLPQNFTGTGF